LANAERQKLQKQLEQIEAKNHDCLLESVAVLSAESAGLHLKQLSQKEELQRELREIETNQRLIS
jgi:hypothetical protein